jgi:predicted ATP-dependent serine protease
LSSNQRQQRLQIRDDDEFNQVLGGGLVPDSLLLLGGDPGVGKSTLSNFGSNNNNNNNSRLDGVSNLGINGNNYPTSISNIDLSSNQRQQRLQIPDDDEFNQVLGGGLVPGSLLLLGLLYQATIEDYSEMLQSELALLYHRALFH